VSYCAVLLCGTVPSVVSCCVILRGIMGALSTINPLFCVLLLERLLRTAVGSSRLYSFGFRLIVIGVCRLCFKGMKLAPCPGHVWWHGGLIDGYNRY